MDWLRRNFMAFIVLGAIALSFVISDHDSAGRDQAQHAQLVQTCERGSYRTSIFTNFMIDAARARAAVGDKAISERYYADALGLAATIPAPAGRLVADPLLWEVKRQKLVTGVVVYVPTARARALQHIGCERANS